MTSGSAGGTQGRRHADPADRVLLHIDIIVSLMRRDLQSRFGHNVLGFSWTFVPPLAWVAAAYFAFTIFGRTSPVYTDVITFILSGLLPYAAFRYVISSIIRSSGQVRGLLIFPNVTREHALVGAAIIEWVNIVFVFAVVALGNYFLTGNAELADPLHFTVGVGLAWLLGVSYAYFFNVLARFNRTFDDLASVILRPTIFISGVFFVANEVPESLLEILSWNPLLHAIEYARDGMLFHYESRVASPAYVLVWVAGFTLAGFVIDKFRRR